MLGNLNGWHLVIIVFVILLLFGAPKLPQLARSVGQSMKIFKSEVREATDDGTDAAATAKADATTAAATPATEAGTTK